MPYREPQWYEHNERDRARYKTRFWRFPPRLVKDGEFARWWREQGKRGGGSIASTLPVLAVETWPGKSADSAVLDRVRGRVTDSDDPLWTPYAALSYRRIATLSGTDKGTIRRTLERMGSLGIAETMKVNSRRQEGNRRTYFRLTERLFAGEGEKFTKISGGLVYDGHWQMLPTPAARHLYLVLAALEPVYDAQALRDVAADPFAIEVLRERHAVSWADLMELSGLSRRTLVEALDILTTPIHKEKTLPLFDRGGSAPFWYARNAEAATWAWTVNFLNGPKPEIGRSQKAHWPKIAVRIPAKRRRQRTRAAA